MCTVWERKPRRQYYSSFPLEHNATLTYYAETGNKHYAAIREIIAKNRNSFLSISRCHPADM